MLRRIFTASLTLAVVVGISSLAWAQGRGGASTFGSSGFGNSSFGSSAFGGMGSSGFGSSSFGGMGFGGMGSTGFGGSGFGSSSFGSSMFGGSGFGGSAFGNSFGQSGFGGQNGGQAFIGRDGANMAATFNQMGRAGAQFFNQMNRNIRNRNRQNNNSSNSEAVTSEVRVRLQLAFNPARPTATVLTNTIRTRLTNILSERGITTPDVAVEEGVAVLRGVAESENQRRVLAQLIAMEPGVMGVRNEMTVAGTSNQ
jgi:hypothetical protein